MNSPARQPQNRLSFWISILSVPVICVAVILWSRANSDLKQIDRINRANPELQAASKHAQATLNDFIKRLQKKDGQAQFAIDALFHTSAGPEYLWVRVQSFDKGSFAGRIDQIPLPTNPLKKGDHVQVDRKDVYDWAIRENGNVEGMFTEKVLSGKR